MRNATFRRYHNMIPVSLASWGAGTRPGSCRSETQARGELGIPIIIARSLLLSFRILSLTGSPDSILTVLVISHLTRRPRDSDYESNGPVAPGYRRLPADRPVGRKTHNECELENEDLVSAVQWQCISRLHTM
jgi:hypothetical protein